MDDSSINWAEILSEEAHAQEMHWKQVEKADQEDIYTSSEVKEKKICLFANIFKEM